MNVALDQLESLWPSYRGAVLLGAARESQGRVSNARVAVVAGHVALSLEVNSPAASRGTGGTRDDHQPADIGMATSTSPLVDHGPRSWRPLSPALRLTVLLDTVPDSAPKPGTRQMARFLTNVLSQAPEEAGGGKEEGEGGIASGSRPGGESLVSAAALPRREEGQLGRDVPEMLVVEHTDEVRTIFMRLIIVRIRFRASDFGLVAKIQLSRCKIETGFLCGDGVRVVLFFARVIQQSGFWTQKIQANVDCCYDRHRAERASLGPGLEHRSLRSESSLAAKRRAEALHVIFFSQSSRAQHERCCSVCTLA